MLTRNIRLIPMMLLMCITHIQASAQRIICDETCKSDGVATNQAHESKSPGYAVVSPIGLSAVEMISQAPRLETLEGKTIAIVGVSFMTHITHPEIRNLIKQHYPSATVILSDEIGYAGPYPAPGVTRKAKEEFQNRLKEMGVDAVISGNGGCGLCTPKEVGSCIAAEYIGIPSVMIVGPGFIEQAKYTSRNNGVPVMRVAEYPGAFAMHSADELIRNTREVLWPQIVNALTTPISNEERAADINGVRGDIRDDIFYGTVDEINAYYNEMKWSDGLPIVPPTFEKVQSFLKYTDLKWDETVAVLPIHIGRPLQF